MLQSCIAVSWGLVCHEKRHWSHGSWFLHSFMSRATLMPNFPPCHLFHRRWLDAKEMSLSPFFKGTAKAKRSLLFLGQSDPQCNDRISRRTILQSLKDQSDESVVSRQCTKTPMHFFRQCHLIPRLLWLVFWRSSFSFEMKWNFVGMYNWPRKFRSTEGKVAQSLVRTQIKLEGASCIMNIACLMCQRVLFRWRKLSLERAIVVSKLFGWAWIKSGAKYQST